MPRYTKKRTISRIPRIRSRGTGSTFDISQHERRVSPRKPSQYQKRLFAVNVHCKKNQQQFFYLYTVFCASLFLLLCWTSPLNSWDSLKICKKNMLDRPSSSGCLCFIIYDLVGLWVYIWRRNEPPRCPVLFVRATGWTATQWRRPEPVVTNHCCNPDSSETFFYPFNLQCLWYQIYSIDSIFLFFPFFFKISKKHVHLYCQVLWFGVFLYIRHEFDTAVVAIFIRNIFCRKFSISFSKKTKKELQPHNLFCFFYDCFFLFPMLWHFFFILDIAKSAVSLSVQGLFFNINVNGVKMHVQHSWKKKSVS